MCTKTEGVRIRKEEGVELIKASGKIDGGGGPDWEVGQDWFKIGNKNENKKTRKHEPQ